MIKYVQIVDNAIVNTYEEFPGYLVGAQVYPINDVTIGYDPEINYKSDSITLVTIENNIANIQYNLKFKDLAEVKSVLSARVTKERTSNVYTNGLIEWNNHVWDVNQFSIINITAYMLAIISNVYTKDYILWRTADNYIVKLGILDFKEFASVLLDYVNTEFTNSWEKKDSFQGSLSIEEVLSLANHYKILN